MATINWLKSLPIMMYNDVVCAHGDLPLWKRGKALFLGGEGLQHDAEFHPTGSTVGS